MTLITFTFHLLSILTAPACPDSQHWTYIPQSQLYACTQPYPAEVTTP